MTGKLGRFVVLVAGLAGAVPAVADELRPDQARHFISGKHFTYTCFDGTTGAGRIYADGSVVGYIRIGSNAPRFVALPVGTLRVSGGHYCAYMRGLPFSPCFNIDRTSQISFRGSISGLGFAYCDFHRRSTRADLLHSKPLSLRPSMATAN
jgi:hypothetical protein